MPQNKQENEVYESEVIATNLHIQSPYGYVRIPHPQAVKKARIRFAAGLIAICVFCSALFGFGGSYMANYFQNKIAAVGSDFSSEVPDSNSKKPSSTARL